MRGQPGAGAADDHRRLSAGRDEGVEFARRDQTWMPRPSAQPMIAAPAVGVGAWI